MTANQIPYDRLDWLQIAIYFLALPIVALLGAAIGLLGRWRRGGMLWSTNVGLLGGAVACVILAVGIATTGIHGSRWFYAYFEGQYRWMMLIMTLLATAACALVAGVAWRLLHRPREKQPLTISIGNVMLVQLFAMISLGSFVGLRLFMLQTTGKLPVAERIVRIHGWVLDQNGRQIVLDSTSMSPQENEAALGKTALEEVAKVATLEYAYFNLDGAWNVDLTPLLKHEKLKSMLISLQQPTNSQLAPLINSNLKALGLNGDTSHIDFSRFRNTLAIENLSLMGVTSRTGIEALEQAPLKHLFFQQVQILGTGQPIRAWPQEIEGLSVRNSNFMPEDFASLANHPHLKSINLFDIVLAEKDLAFLPTIPTLTSAILLVDANTPTWHEPLGNLHDKTLRLDLHSDDFAVNDAANLVSFEKLLWLNLDLADHGNDIIDDLCKVTSLERLTITSPNLTEEALMKLAVLPALRELYYPPHLNTPSIIKNFLDKRKELGLPHVGLVPKPHTLKPASKKAKKPQQSQNPAAPK